MSRTLPRRANDRTADAAATTVREASSPAASDSAGHREASATAGSVCVLALSDRVDELVYSTRARARYRDVDLVIACGDLPYSYVEYVTSCLDRPTFFVRGNHDQLSEDGPAGPQRAPLGAVDLHRRVVRHDGLLLAGVEGSVRYKPGPFQSTQLEMWLHVLHLLPGLLYNRLRFGRWLDVFVSHAPPRGIHDRPDPPHHGIDAFRWLLRVARPTVHLHGHVHLYGPNTPTDTVYGATRVANAYGSRVLAIVPGGELAADVPCRDSGTKAGEDEAPRADRG